MKIQGNHPVIDKLLTGNDEIIFNLVSLIREDSNARLYTDGRSYLTAQTNAFCPMWIFTNANADEQTEHELFPVFSKAIEENAHLCINAQEGFAEKALFHFAKQNGLNFTKNRTLYAYSVRKVREVAPMGHLIAADIKYKKEIANLIRQMMTDDNDGNITEEEAMQFAEANVNANNLYLWEHGEIVSMARVARYGTKYARLTAVVTERAKRGNGYAKMLVGELSNRLLAEGIIPMLYANAENPSSNRCYQKLGFEKAGEICEFRMDRSV